MHSIVLRPLCRILSTQTDGESLRSIQAAAADAIFNTNENVLLTASTASGKTEAAFFPILTLFSEDPPASVGALVHRPAQVLLSTTSSIA